MKNKIPLHRLAKKIRKEKNISLRKLAKLVGCSHQLLYLWEEGRHSFDHNDELIVKISKELGINDDEAPQESLSLSKATLTLKQAFSVDMKNAEKFREFFNAAEKGIESSTWDEILAAIRRQRG